MEAAMDSAKLFQNGKSQAVRLPKNYRFRGSKVYIKRMGNAIILIPEDDSWQSMIESLSLFSDDFMTERTQPAVEERESPFE
jgi:antitoxin VapB